MKGVRNPLVLLAVNFITGIAISQGLIPPEHGDTVSNLLAEVFGYTLLALTSLVSLYKVFQHKGLEGKEEENKVTVTQQSAPPVEIPIQTSDNTGTPPVSASGTPVPSQ